MTDRQVEKLGFPVVGWPLLLEGKRIGLRHQRESATNCAYFVNSSIWNTPKSKGRQPDKGRYFLHLGLVWYNLERVFMFQTTKRQTNLRNISSCCIDWKIGKLVKQLCITAHVSITKKLRSIGVLHMSALCGSCLPVIVRSMLLLNPGLERFVTRCSPQWDLPPW